MRVLFILILSFLSFSATADEGKEVSCNFVQTKKSAMFAEAMVSHGKMYFCYPDKVRWEYTTPVHTIFIMNGQEAAMINEQGRKKKMDIARNGLFRSITDIISAGMNDSGDRYEIERNGNIMVMKPLRSDMKKVFDTITITFGPSDIPVSVHISEKNGDSTIIEFTQISTSVDDKSVFNY